ncbi:SSI family serine proteinase inhibitor [Actinophytocola sp.]|uniref:SSI family serine proteinase inhibitor n=1 Tax=Actinophytocola sp. TaxID=1872138 RepID=UPI003899E57A
MNFTRLSGALLAVALPFAFTGVASASPDTSLVLTLVDDNGGAESVFLTCDPPEGTHPNASSACAQIRAAQGDFSALRGEEPQMMCTMEYLPVTAIAEGTWLGSPIEWTHEFGNGCTLHTATGAVFLF